MHLSGDDPAVLSGRVASSRTDVLVFLDGSERLWLKVDRSPSLSAGDLRTDLRVRVRGRLSGPSTAPEIAADELRVKPGRLEGVVIAVDEAEPSFWVQLDEVDDPFGGADLPDPVLARFTEQAKVEEDASSVVEFFQLFVGLDPGARLEVRLFGLADGFGAVDCYQLEVERVD